MELSSCCGAENRMTNINGPDFKDIGICPDCKDHCEFEESYDCPIHGDLGEIDFCPECGT